MPWECGCLLYLIGVMPDTLGAILDGERCCLQKPQASGWSRWEVLQAVVCLESCVILAVYARSHRAYTTGIHPVSLGFNCHMHSQVDVSQIPSMDTFIGAQADLRKTSKIGEGTYGEAFKFNKCA